MTKENKKSKSVAIVSFVPVGSHYWIYLRLFAMLSSGKNQDLSKGFDIAFSDILLCTISYTQTTYLHTIRVSDNKSRVNSIILVVTAICTKILPIIQI